MRAPLIAWRHKEAKMNLSISGSLGSDPYRSSQSSSSASNRLDKMFSKIDADGDGKITKAEMEQAFANRPGGTQKADQLFAAMDPDGTGSITKDQFAAGMQKMHRHGAKPPSADDLFGKADADGDGKVTKDELEKAMANAPGGTARADKMFSAMDTDGSGDVSKSEMESFFAKMKAEGQAQLAATSAASDSISSAGQTDSGSGSASNPSLAALLQNAIQSYSAASGGSSSASFSQPSLFAVA
jgi:Ca2+-binding EF-hand superfamily protein